MTQFIKKFAYVLLILSAISVIPLQPIQARDQVSENNKTIIEVFERADCGHCQNFFAFTNELQKTRDDFTVISYDILSDENRAFFDEVTDKLKLVKATPVIYLNHTVISGFDTPETSGQRIIALLDQAKTKDSIPSLADYINQPENARIETYEGTCAGEFCQADGTLVKIPFSSKVIDVAKYSLPALSFILGVVDGFNPCAMWVLLMFLAALVAIGNKRKMWQMVGFFLLAEAIMYYLILTVWLYAWDFIGLDRIVTPIIGLIAIGAGVFFLREYLRDDNTCKVTDLEQRAKLSQKIKNFAERPLTIITALGIIGLAFSVNVIEFACSIGIPQTFTKILDLNALPWLTKQIYNFIYIIGYMMDDFLVFGIALYSFDKIGVTAKYSRLSHLIGGLLMILLGLLLLLKPGVLMF